MSLTSIIAIVISIIVATACGAKMKNGIVYNHHSGKIDILS